MTYRERRYRKAERLREWAEKREAKASTAFDAAETLGGQIPLGQPILVGHHSEKRHRKQIDRIDRSIGKGVEDSAKAREFKSRADNIEAAAERAVYSDDEDAAEQLEARIAELEAERTRIKAYNASCRKASKAGGVGDLSLLSEKEREDVSTLARVASFQLGPGGAMPSYKLSNLSGNINRNKKRLASLKTP